MTDFSFQFSSRLEKLLTEQGISQRKLASDLHLSPNTVNGYIKNRRFPDCETLVQIADYLGTNVDYLLGNTNLRVYPQLPLSEKELFLLNHYRSLDSMYQDMLIEISAALYAKQFKRRTDKK